MFIRIRQRGRRLTGNVKGEKTGAAQLTFYNIYAMLDQCRRCWADFVCNSYKCFVHTEWSVNTHDN